MLVMQGPFGAHLLCPLGTCSMLSPHHAQHILAHWRAKLALDEPIHLRYPCGALCQRGARGRPPAHPIAAKDSSSTDDE